MIILQQENQQWPSRIDYLREKVNNKDYLYEGIQRIAQLLSDELLDIPQRGACYEWQRPRRK
jgi:hypothetical protein